MAAPPSYADVMAYREADDRRRGRTASIALAIGGVFHFLAIPVALFFLKVLVESVARRSVGWDELFNAFAQTGGMTILLIGIGGQIAFAILAVAGAMSLRSRPSSVAYGMIVSGVVGLIFSFVVFGGFMGIIGGIATLAGGAVGLPKSMPMGYSSIPPPYPPPSPPQTPPGAP